MSHSESKSESQLELELESELESTLQRMGREAREQGWVPPIHAPAHG